MGVVHNPLLHVILLAMLPVSELRGAIPLGILAHRLDPWTVVPLCVLANLAVIPLLYFTLNFIHRQLMKSHRMAELFHRYIERNRRKIERHIGTRWEFWMLILFVGIPLPVTGAYTGVVLAWFFRLPVIRSFAALGLGVLLSATIVTTLVLAGSGGFRALFF